MRRFITAFGLTFVGASLWLSMPPASAASPSSEDALLSGATHVFRRIADAPSTAIPAAVLQQAKAIAVVPAASQFSGIISGSGILSRRITEVDWTLPVALEFEGRIDPPIDSRSLDVILVAMTQRGVQRLIELDRTSNVSSNLVPGPLDNALETGADVLAYVEFGDFFAGVTVTDWSLCDAPIVNTRLYGMPYSAADLFRMIKGPLVVEQWRTALQTYYRRES